MTSYSTHGVPIIPTLAPSSSCLWFSSRDGQRRPPTVPAAGKSLTVDGTLTGVEEKTDRKRDEDLLPAHIWNSTCHSCTGGRSRADEEPSLQQRRLKRATARRAEAAGILRKIRPPEEEAPVFGWRGSGAAVTARTPPTGDTCAHPIISDICSQPVIGDG